MPAMPYAKSAPSVIVLIFHALQVCALAVFERVHESHHMNFVAKINISSVSSSVLYKDEY